MEVCRDAGRRTAVTITNIAYFVKESSSNAAKKKGIGMG
jgi:hypothetical protein